MPIAQEHAPHATQIMDSASLATQERASTTLLEHVPLAQLVNSQLEELTYALLVQEIAKLATAVLDSA